MISDAIFGHSGIELYARLREHVQLKDSTQDAETAVNIVIRRRVLGDCAETQALVAKIKGWVERTQPLPS